MAKKKRARRSAIVPRLLLSAGLMSGGAVVPMLSGCGGGGAKLTVACVGYPNCQSVAYQGFDMSADQSFSVADLGFDLRNADADSDAG